MVKPNTPRTGDHQSKVLNVDELHVTPSTQNSVETLNIDFAKGKVEVFVDKFTIYFNPWTCKHCKEIHLELSLRSVEN